MSILCDMEIEQRCRVPTKPMIKPFIDRPVKLVGQRKVVSFGLGSYGYDIRCSDDFQIFTNVHSTHVDPKNFNPKSLVPADIHYDEQSGRYIVIPPNSYALARSLEWFDIPRDILVECIGKSTYVRCGINCNVTPLEPEWRGHITLEIANNTPLPARVYANEGIMQLIFHKADHVCKLSYADKGGKYQDQENITHAKV